MKKLLVTGSSGLIGSEICKYFDQENWQVIGIDNNQRKKFFGDQGDTSWNTKRLMSELQNYQHIDLDIRMRDEVLTIVTDIKPNAIVHTAAQPSHDKAAEIPFDDFDVNAVSTLNLLEATRKVSNTIPFVHFSTNKVYGDAPNRIELVEKKKRWDFADKNYEKGIAESFPIDQSKHSLFGASKVAADIMVQEYGRYFDMPTCCLRGGCLTGPNHAGVELHGFLSYLIKCNLERKNYNIFGYKGKQVRDNIHSHDVARFIDEFLQNPRSGEVYNLGGGKDNTCSILEAFEMIEEISGIEQKYKYLEQNRSGDHICYYSDLTKMKNHYPKWDISISLKEIFEQIYSNWKDRVMT
jgi:CDP-paratose 2-epimerase